MTAPDFASVWERLRQLDELPMKPWPESRKGSSATLRAHLESPTTPGISEHGSHSKSDARHLCPLRQMFAKTSNSTSGYERAKRMKEVAADPVVADWSFVTNMKRCSSSTLMSLLQAGRITWVTLPQLLPVDVFDAYPRFFR